MDIDKLLEKVTDKAILARLDFNKSHNLTQMSDKINKIHAEAKAAIEQKLVEAREQAVKNLTDYQTALDKERLDK